MSVCIEKIKCPKCKKTTLQTFLEEDQRLTGFCFNPECGKWFDNPYGDEPDKEKIMERSSRSEEEIKQEMAEVGGYPIVDCPSRKLRASTLEKFGAKTSMSEQDGITPTAIYWPVTREGKVVSYHVRGLFKDEKGKTPTWNLGKGKDGDLLNWENAKRSGAYRLIITEGPEDMASVDRIYEMHGDKAYPVAVVSLPRGSPSSRKVCQKHSEDIQRLFKEVVLCFDDDDAGRQAVKDALLSLPNAKTVKLPYKDANECLVNGVAKQAFKALAFSTYSPKNTSIIFGSDLHEVARTPAEWGSLHWPFPKLNEVTRNIRTGETIYIGAGVKMGKGELRNEIAAHFIKEDGAKVFVVSPEEPPKKTYKLLAGKLVSKIFHDPKIDFNYEAYDEAGTFLRNSAAILNVYQNITWENVKKEIVCAAEWGAKAHFIDPITNFTDHLNAAEANTELQRIAQEASTLALDLDIVVFLFCHLKAPDGVISQEQRDNKYKNQKYIGLGNCSHETGGTVISSQFHGSRAMMRKCNLMLGLEGNKDPELPKEIRNMRNLKVLEDREFGSSETIKLYWNDQNGRFSEI